MWALVESNSVSKIYTRPTTITVGNVQYPSNIFTMWSESELNAISIYTITINNSNLKDSEYYYNTDITYTYSSSGSGSVTGAYGTPTAKNLADTTSTVNGKSSTVLGLKSVHKSKINSEANNLLQQYDWYTLRAASGGTAIPSSVTTYQAAVRTKANSMCTAVDNASDVDALIALYVYNDDDPPVRPLGEFPDEPS